MKFNLIAPSIAETQITGLIVAAEKTIRKQKWRVEFHKAGQHVRLYKNGSPVT